eukprot:scaffold264446_cov33-Tisochrysis_lutea.AAC.4
MAFQEWRIEHSTVGAGSSPGEDAAALCDCTDARTTGYCPNGMRGQSSRVRVHSGDSFTLRWSGDLAGSIMRVASASGGSSIALTSARVPLTAAAAAIIGDMRWVRPPAP